MDCLICLFVMLPGDETGARRLAGLRRYGSDPDKSFGKGVGERKGARENRFSKRFPSPPRNILFLLFLLFGEGNIL